jgi:hypothetical protein
MPNLHLRDLPSPTLELLKETAQANGRSLNAELLHVLNEEADRLQRTRTFLGTVQPRVPRKAVDFEKVIREDREDREARAL